VWLQYVTPKALVIDEGEETHKVEEAAVDERDRGRDGDTYPLRS